MNIPEVVLREISYKCSTMANDSLNELVEFAVKSLINHKCFDDLSIMDLSFLYKTFLGGYIVGLNKAFDAKISTALSEMDNPESVKKAMSDPEFQKFCKDMRSGT